jgi:CRISPR/Cas system CSM-associated protein Csm3 (group 7 of RAMP superfamily)
MTELFSLDVSITLHFDQPFHLGTGRREGLVHRTVRRTADGRPYVPASAIKGALRQTAERVVRTLDAAEEFGDVAPQKHLGYRRRGTTVVGEPCRAPRPEEMCQSPTPCLVCRVFGNVYTGRRLIVDDAYPAASPETNSLKAVLASRGVVSGDAAEEDGQVLRVGPPDREGQTETITRLQMDRRRRGAKSGALFTTEYARPRSSFSGQLTGEIPRTPLTNDEANGEPAELVLLAAALRATDQIGGETSTGRGQCRFAVENPAGAEAPPALQIGGSAYPVDDLLASPVLEALRWSRIT